MATIERHLLSAYRRNSQFVVLLTSSQSSYLSEQIHAGVSHYAHRHSTR
jgi:hypothetical protein